MYSPTTRLLTVLELLQSQGSITGPELATKLEVDVRSVRRYITMLRDLGIPVESEPGRYGAYYLRPGFRLPPLMFNNPEIMAIILGLVAVRHLGLSGAVGVASATAKIDRVLPDELRERVRAIQDVLALDIKPQHLTTSEELIAQFSVAAYQHTQMHIAYQSSAQDVTERVVDVYGLVYHLNYWYAVGYCHLRGDVRVFRLDRVRTATNLESTFTPPENFDALRHLWNTIATIPNNWQIEVLLLTSIEDAKIRVPAIMAVLEEVPDGVLLRTGATDLDWMARYLVSLHCPLRVLQPPELRDALRDLATNIMAMTELPASESVL